MHVPDGFLDAPTSAVTGAVAVAAVGVALVKARNELDDRTAPMAGLVAAFIFAVQMLNFQVLPGVSGHLLGGTLAAVLVGPYLGAICVSIVLVVQALIFSDGGVTALGLNITNMALLGTAVGSLVVATLLRVVPRRTWALTAAAVVGSVVSVTVASQGFVLEYYLGGAVDVDRSLGAIAAVMAGSHLLIGLGEGVITALTVTYVAKVRPDLVYAVRNLPRPVISEAVSV
jgi:cobalt/nickel transport system permease protein